MQKRRALLAVSVLLFLCTSLAFARGVVKIRLDDTIQPISDEYIG